ncbi:MAG: hypothetical protein IPP28_10490 [Xanthomonadales bacterium]|nr:hypothetical protein [Xanthomonadales bacterium]
MFGRVDIVYDRRADALVIPREALIEGDAEAAVFVLEPAPAEKADAKKATPAPGFFSGWFGGKDKAAVKPEKDSKPVPTFIAKRREVKLGYTSGTDAEIVSGLNDGDRVVTVGKAALRDGGKVQVVEANTP